MNYEIQSKKLKPNAKSCDWCKSLDSCFRHDGTYVKDIPDYRQSRKLIREDFIRYYCKKYKFSKKNFNEWKQFRKENELMEV